MEKDIILKVRKNKNGQKQITIPKESNIEEGDYIKVIKLKHGK